MKEKELRQVAKCAMCKKPIGHTGLPLFWRVRLQRYGLKAEAIRRQSALEQFFDGHIALAQIMGANEDMADKMLDIEVTICETCGTKPTMIAALAMEEDGNEGEKK